MFFFSLFSICKRIVLLLFLYILKRPKEEERDESIGFSRKERASDVMICMHVWMDVGVVNESYNNEYILFCILIWISTRSVSIRKV